VAIIVSSGQEIEYGFFSPTLREIVGVRLFRRGDPLPNASATSRFNRDHQNRLSAKEVESTCCLSAWFPDAPAHEMNEDILGLGKYGKTLTVWFTENDCGRSLAEGRRARAIRKRTNGKAQSVGRMAKRSTAQPPWGGTMEGEKGVGPSHEPRKP